jgi:hypothetical protein
LGHSSRKFPSGIVLAAPFNSRATAVSAVILASSQSVALAMQNNSKRSRTDSAAATSAGIDDRFCTAGCYGVKPTATTMRIIEDGRRALAGK